MQFLEDLSDRQAAEAVRTRIDWKYLLGLELEDAGFDYSILSEFRRRIIAGQLERELLDRMLAVFQEQGLVKERGKQRSDSTHVIAAVRQLNRWEMLGETMRATLNDLAEVAPGWVRKIAPVEWYERYESRIEHAILPKERAKRDKWIQAVGEDGIYLLTQLFETTTHRWLWDRAAVQVLRQVWVHQFCQVDGQLQLREKDNLPPSSIRFDSPYDPEVHYSSKRSTEWTGYKVHLTESCDADLPHLITNVETTIAPQPDVTMTATIHQALAEKDCLPGTHLVDAGYVDADLIVESQTQHDIHLLGPVRSFPEQAENRFTHDDFQIDWNAQTVTCPNQAVTISWRQTLSHRGNDVIQARFSLKDCRLCPIRSNCTSSKSARILAFRPQLQFEALQQGRKQIKNEAWQKEYAQRAGVEGTISQGIRGFGLRQCRYIGLAKTHLQHILTAAAINITRVDAWFTGRRRAKTRVSHFKALAPIPAFA
jgi:transposase